MGVCNGLGKKGLHSPKIKTVLTLLELCPAMARRSPIGDYRRLYYNQLLGSGAEI